MTAILGGGIAGLSAAYYLTRNSINPITIYEATSRLGGWIRTEKHKGFLLESGPRTIRPKGPAAANTLQLIEELGLAEYVNPIYPNHPAAKNRMIYVKNQLCRLPSDFKGIFKKLPPFSKPLISGIFNDIKTSRNKQKLQDESIYDFVERRFGYEIAEYAISPMICGICAGDAKEISVRFLMNDLFENEQKYGGVLKGIFLGKLFNKKPKKIEEIINSKLAEQAKEEKWSIYSLQGGLELLPTTLETKLKENDVEIKNRADCKTIHFHNDRIILNINGMDTYTDYVISALPSHKLGKLVEDQHPSLACQLKSIPYVNVAVVNLQYDTGTLLKEDAFGVLVPPSENLPILGIIFDSCCYDMFGNTVLTVMMGGKWFEDYFGTNPTQKDFFDIALEQIKNILKIERQPKLARVNILKNCIPQYTVGHRARVEAIQNYIIKHQLPLSICGSAYYGVGVNDVILSAKRTVDSLLEANNQK